MLGSFTAAAQRWVSAANAWGQDGWQALFASEAPRDAAAPGTSMGERVVVEGVSYVLLAPPLAHGGYATVYAAQRQAASAPTDTVSTFVVKVTRGAPGDRALQMAVNELEVYRRLEAAIREGAARGAPAPTIVRCHGGRATQDPIGSVYLVLERLHGGALTDLFQQRRVHEVPLEESLLRHIFVDVASAVAFLHALRPEALVHRDVKLENVLLDERTGRWKLCDFGSCTSVSGAVTPVENDGGNPVQFASTRGAIRHPGTSDSFVSPPDRKRMIWEAAQVEGGSTQMYRAPEMADVMVGSLDGHVIGPKVDVWALGCILFTLAYGYHPFEGGGALQIASGIEWSRVDSQRRQHYSPALEILLRGLLEMRPQQRWSTEDALRFAREQWRVGEERATDGRGSEPGEAGWARFADVEEPHSASMMLSPPLPLPPSPPSPGGLVPENGRFRSGGGCPPPPNADSGNQAATDNLIDW
ncbi:hypothetical protein CDCA_CDCA05G1671 [Cyanidium caldarium]|uniref:non-specific serine/threonine protein kinase n=1 Tax=Cyanidium caldarium TaxID=2771 RepID=A0AAV9IU94_CYACA|nr:hypothetical protein CDCA_CDCA05G1671 [Cyanidium caldarium]